MIKQKTFLEVVRGTKTYQLICECDSQLGELHDVLSEMKGYVIQRINEIREQEAKALPPIPEQVVEKV
jgi:hypothetical protein